MRTLALVAAAVVLACGLALRARGMTKALWLDEAWVANSTLENNLTETLYYPSWVQSSPPGFLVLVRTANAFFPLSNASLRIIPFLSGAVGLVVMGYLSFKLLRPLAAIWSVTLFSFSPIGIYYSHALKQYSSELTCSVLLLTAVWSYILDASTRKYLVLLTVIVASMMTAYGIIYFLPGVLVLLCPYWRDDGKQLDQSRATLRWWGITVAVAITATVVYFAFVRPNRSEYLTAFFWSDHPVGLYMQVKHLFTRFQQILELLIPLPVIFERLGLISRRLWTLAFLAFGIYGIILAPAPNRYRRFVFLMVAAPCAVAVLFDLLRIYPLVYNGRTSLILLPCVTLAFATSLETIERSVRRKFSSEAGRTTIRSGDLYATTTGVLMILMTVFIGVKESLRFDPISEDVAAAVQFVSTNFFPSDFVFVHASCQPSFRLYARMYKWSFPSSVRFGKTGSPCCARNAKVTISSREEVVQDFLSNIPENKQRVWLLATQRKAHWANFAFDESALLTSMLLSAGCDERPVPKFTNVRLGLFDCGDDLSERVSNIISFSTGTQSR